MKKISLYITNLHYGGAEKVLVNMANEFFSRGFAVDVVLVRAQGQLVKHLHSEIKVVDLKSERILKSFSRLISYLRRSKPDVLIAFMWPLTIIALAANFISGRSYRTKVLVTEHCSWSKQLPKNRYSQFLIKYSMRYLYIFAHKIIAVSEGAKQDLLTFVKFRNSNQLQTIYNPVVNLNLKHSEPSQDPSEWTQGSHQKILAVGNLKEVKDYITMIKALKIVVAAYDVKLLILGEGKMRATLQALIHQLGLDKNCFLYGHVENPEIYYQVADVFVLSSSSEGLANVLIEALSHGLSTVSTDCPYGPSEVLENGRYGRLVPLGDIEQFAFEMMNALKFPSDKNLLKQQSSFFSITKAVDEYLKTIGVH